MVFVLKTLWSICDQVATRVDRRGGGEVSSKERSLFAWETRYSSSSSTATSCSLLRCSHNNSECRCPLPLLSSRRAHSHARVSCGSLWFSSSVAALPSLQTLCGLRSDDVAALVYFSFSAASHLNRTTVC